jgi:RNA polymerase sigma-70 factor (ECF subfamily)
VDFAPILHSNRDLLLKTQSCSVSLDMMAMIEIEDLILVQQALRGEPKSFGELCRRYYPSLTAIADSILLDHHLAEDAAQETLAEACRNLKTLKRPESFGAWVGTICRNVAKDMLREQPRQRKAAEEYASLENDCDDRDHGIIMTEAVQQLPQHLREVVYLRFYNEMSYEQMAKVLGATQQSIDGRLRRAKKKIAAYLAKKGFRR